MGVSIHATSYKLKDQGATYRNDMKRSPIFVVCMVFALLFSQKAWGQVNFYDARVSDYGQLEQVLGDKWNTVDSLIVHGPINEADFTTIWKCSFDGKLTVLNLEHAQVENNKIPVRALFKRDRQAIDDPRAYQGVVYLPIRRLILPEGIQEIGDFAFSRMRLEQVNLPKSLRKLGRSCFSSCHWLSTDPLIIPEGITDIPTQCFVNCQSFGKLILPSTLKSIGISAFYNTRVVEVNFPEGLEQIKLAAFLGSDLIEAILPNTVIELGESIFSMCPALKKIQLPEHINTIPASLASWCPLLETVNIPKSVTIIDEAAFCGDVMLKPVNLPNGLKRIEKDALWYVAVDSIVDELMHYMVNEQGCYLASKEEQDALTNVVLAGGKLNRKCVGRDAKTLLGMIGVTVPDNIRCITFEGPKEHPLIATELMMPILGVVRAKDFDDAVEQAVWLEHGNRHSAHIHSKNVDRITKYAKAIDTAILVKNGPSYAALGFGGEGFCTFTIASRTGEGLTSASSFTKRRRCVMTDSLCIR